MPEGSQISRVEIYFMKDQGEVGGLAFYDKFGKELVFQSKILRQNWAKEDHDEVREFSISNGDRLLGLKCLQIVGEESVGSIMNLQFLIGK